MAENYFHFLGQNEAMANVTVRADADCFLLCDGEYFDVQFEAGKLTKIQVPVGQHLLEFIYTKDANIKVEKVVDFPEPGRNYVVLVQDLKAAVDNVAAEAKAKEDAKRKAEEEAKRQAEYEAKGKALRSMDFVQKYLNENSDRNEFRKRFTDNEIKKAVDEEIRPAAEFGNNASAQFVLGVYYTDDAEKLNWFRKAAEQGYAKAQNMVGQYYFDGYGVQKDYAEAVKWYRKAAEQGNSDAQVNLGFCYCKGQGVRLDYAEAEKWYLKAAEQDVVAQNMLAECYYWGYFGQRDYAEAEKWYLKAAEQGNADACYHLSIQDSAEAEKWRRKVEEIRNKEKEL